MTRTLAKFHQQPVTKTPSILLYGTCRWQTAIPILKAVRQLLAQMKNRSLLHISIVLPIDPVHFHNFTYQIFFYYTLCTTSDNFCLLFFHPRAMVLYGRLPFLLTQIFLYIPHKHLFAFRMILSSVYL